MEVLGGLGRDTKRLAIASTWMGMEKATGGELSEYSTVLQTWKQLWRSEDPAT